MSTTQRVADDINRALHALFAADERLYLLGEDIADPYGGAFGITRGLSTQYPERILPTPISENAIAGVAGGLALAGNKAIVEMMFSDFSFLAGDQILNFATKSVSMYGSRMPMHIVYRCPTGGGRGYGPTHSQSLQKHFLGIPHLAVYEASQFHDSATVWRHMLSRDEPAMMFEDKVLYTQRTFRGGTVDDLFQFDFVGDDHEFARVFIEDPTEADCLIIVPGGLVPRALTAARDLFLEEEIISQIVVPSRLYPFSVKPLSPLLSRAARICIADEGTAGASWSEYAAAQIYSESFTSLKAPIAVVNSKDSVIPTSAHLERQMLVSSADIVHAVKESLA